MQSQKIKTLKGFFYIAERRVNINMKKSHWFRLGIVTMTLILLIGLYFAIMSWQVIYVWKTSQGQQSDCIIILGAGVWDGKPSPALQERLDVALQVYKDKLANYIIVSGGERKRRSTLRSGSHENLLNGKRCPRHCGDSRRAIQ
jgi:vancomycin permeability regulator SanA